MSAVILALLRGLGLLLARFWRYIAPFFSAMWPYIRSMFSWVFVFGKYIIDWIVHFFGQATLTSLVTGGLLVAGLVFWGVFLAAFWTFASGVTIAEIFNGNPFSDVSILAGSMYLASHAFPLKFMFGLVIALVHWRFTMIEAAIILNRTIKFVIGF